MLATLVFASLVCTYLLPETNGNRPLHTPLANDFATVPGEAGCHHRD